MKTNTVVVISLTILLAATFGSAQSGSVRAKIPFEFTAAGAVLPAGQYDFAYDAIRRVVTVRGTDKEPTVNVSIVTTLAAAMHTTPRDAHVVFDRIGNSRVLSEIWISGMDGLSLVATKEEHEHEILNVPR